MTGEIIPAEEHEGTSSLDTDVEAATEKLPEDMRYDPEFPYGDALDLRVLSKEGGND